MNNLQLKEVLMKEIDSLEESIAPAFGIACGGCFGIVCWG